MCRGGRACGGAKRSSVDIRIHFNIATVMYVKSRLLMNVELLSF